MTLLLAARVAAAVAATNAPPNLIIILTDDQGYHDVGFNGCQDIPTPNLDSIASHGVRFSSGYVSYSVCSPNPRRKTVECRYRKIKGPRQINLR